MTAFLWWLESGYHPPEKHHYLKIRAKILSLLSIFFTFFKFRALFSLKADKKTFDQGQHTQKIKWANEKEKKLMQLV